MAIVQEHFPLRRAEDLRSGDQIVQPDGWWDRVYSACPWDEDGVEVPGTLIFSRGEDNRAWAARAAAGRRDGTLAREVDEYVAWHRHDRRPTWSDLTAEDLGVLRCVDRLVDETPYPDRASDPADEPFIEQLLAVADHKYEMARILLDPDLDAIRAAAPDPRRVDCPPRSSPAPKDES